MREQASEFGVEVIPGLVETLEQEGQLFRIRVMEQAWSARTVLLATGVVNNRPPISPEIHDAALARGLLRYCPICDGYEVIGKRIAVIGTGTHGVNEALFLRMYSPAVTLIAPEAEHVLTDDERRQLAEAGISLADGPCGSLRIEGEQILIQTSGQDMRFDTLYPALGSIIRSELAVMLGADASEDGGLVVDSHQRTSIPGLYAAGDVAKGLDQISHAMGEAGVAATTIRNDLAQRRALFR